MADLRSLLAARESLYAAADHIIDTSAVRMPEVVEEIYGRLRKRE